MGPTRALTPNSRSSYSSGDYRPLASLTQAQSPVTAESSPPRKRRKMLCKPGKVMKNAYFKGIQWTRTFVSGPFDPLNTTATNSSERCVKQTYLFTPKGHVRYFVIIRRREICGGIKGGATSTSVRWMSLREK